MADGLRQDLPVSYKTTSLRTLIQALKAVFHHKTASEYDYPEEQFRGLNIVTEWPLSRQEWPAIVVKFNEGQITNAGVGHSEEFPDDNGLTRQWLHRHFNGSVEFELLGLSPYDLSVLSDALIEIISFGKLNAVWELFYDKFYGNQTDPYSVLSLLYQINLNSDVISGSGMNVTPAPWQAEDSMVYTCTYDVELSGGFYNSIPPDSNGLGYVEIVDVDGYIEAAEDVPFNDDLDNGWTEPFIYIDFDTVTGVAVITGNEPIVAPPATATAYVDDPDLPMGIDYDDSDTVIGDHYLEPDQGYSRSPDFDIIGIKEQYFPWQVLDLSTTANTTPGNTLSLSFNTGPFSIAVVAVAWKDTTRTITSVTGGGGGWTLLDSQFTTNMRLAWYYRLNSTISAPTSVDVNFSGTTYAVATGVSFTGRSGVLLDTVHGTELNTVLEINFPMPPGLETGYPTPCLELGWGAYTSNTSADLTNVLQGGFPSYHDFTQDGWIKLANPNTTALFRGCLICNVAGSLDSAGDHAVAFGFPVPYAGFDTATHPANIYASISARFKL